MSGDPYRDMAEKSIWRGIHTAYISLRRDDDMSGARDDITVILRKMAHAIEDREVHPSLSNDWPPQEPVIENE